MANACMQHGHCAAELIIACVVEILPCDVNEVTMQKEILSSPKTPPSTLDRLQIVGRDAAPPPLVHQDQTECSSQNTVRLYHLSAGIQHSRTIGNVWDTLYTKHQTRTSDINVDRAYDILSEFLIEVKGQDK